MSANLPDCFIISNFIRCFRASLLFFKHGKQAFYVICTKTRPLQASWVRGCRRPSLQPLPAVATSFRVRWAVGTVSRAPENVSWVSALTHVSSVSRGPQWPLPGPRRATGWTFARQVLGQAFPGLPGGVVLASPRPALTPEGTPLLRPFPRPPPDSLRSAGPQGTSTHVGPWPAPALATCQTP